jgi:MFS transporter, DHA3 family, macrolide efflux protein
MKNYKLLMENAVFVRMWLIHVFAVLGDAFYRVMFFWLAYDLSQNTVIAGVVIFAGTIPYLFFGLPGGVYADRWDRKRTMLGAEILRTGVVLIIPLTAMVIGLNIWVIAAVAFALAMIRCFYHPSMKSAVTSILRDPERSAGVALMEATTRFMQVIGLAAGGFLISGIGAQNLTLVSAVLFAISVVLLLSLIVPERSRAPEPQTLWSDMVESLKYVARMPSLLWSFLLFFFGLLIVVGLERVGLPILSDTVWERGPDGFGILLSAFSLGSILGSLVLGRDDIKRLTLCMAVGWSVWGLSFAALAVSPFNLALFFALLAGVADAMVSVPMVLMIQTRVREDQIGKVFSIWSTSAFLGESGSALLMGGLIQRVGAVDAFGWAGPVLAGVSLGGWALSQSRRTGSDTKT